jgi:hypothetical protein
VPTLDFALGLKAAGCPAHVAHIVGLDIVGQLASDTAGAIIAEQA